MEPLDPNFTFPKGGTVKCGLRVDLPKSQRRHDYRDAGEDMRYQISSGYLRLCAVRICITCGHDDQKVIVRP
jgi:hypothetical protein